MSKCIIADCDHYTTKINVEYVHTGVINCYVKIILSWKICGAIKCIALYNISLRQPNKIMANLTFHKWLVSVCNIHNDLWMVQTKTTRLGKVSYAIILLGRQYIIWAVGNIFVHRFFFNFLKRWKVPGPIDPSLHWKYIHISACCHGILINLNNTS